MKPKPTTPCSNCHLSNWWYRPDSNTIGPGEWLCSWCHPNPNIKEDNNMKEQKIELIDGKFIVTEKKIEEVKLKEEVVIKQKEYSKEVIALKERVILGNQKLFDAWLKIREFAHDSKKWSDEMDRWTEAKEKLSLLCSELKVKGYEDCLYIDADGKRSKNCLNNPNGFWCQVCPSRYRYWEEDAGKILFKNNKEEKK